MRSRASLRRWTAQLLPHQSKCARGAAWDLLRSLLLGFSVNLAQLARQADRDSTTKSARQRFARWLEGPQWEATTITEHLLALVTPWLQQDKVVPLLIDATDLADGWQVLQVSVPFAGRALPVYRAVRAYEDPEETQAELVTAALEFLAQHLPGPRQRYVIVMDRGFPSHALVRQLQAGGWRFVLRVKSNWKLTHPEHAGSLRELVGGPWVGPQPQVLRDGVLGDRTKGAGKRVRHCQAHVVTWYEPGHPEPWFLVTSEQDAAFAVQVYAARMQIECEFRDLKGPWGLDELAQWQDEARIARFLTWVAVYEWRLAYLWLYHRLATFARQLQVTGKLSWIRTTREWLQHRMRTGTFSPHACL